jgi:20S proteasome alpha/beta subunit
MTVCVALYSSTMDAFVCATDAMISTGDMSADSAATKFTAISNNYLTMFAGNDISAINPIIRAVNKTLRTIPDADETVDHVVNAFKAAFAAERLKKAEGTIMPPGMTLQEFYANGLNQLGGELFSRLFHELETTKLDIQFLVCGFDNRKNPVLFTISDPGIESHYDLLGFWAIGSGTNNAIGSLFNLRGTARITYMKEEEVIYRALEAKFFAESAAGVGKETRCLVIYKDSERGILHGIDPIRGIWEKSSLRPLPDGVKGITDKIVANSKKMMKRIKKQREKQVAKDAKKKKAAS